MPAVRRQSCRVSCPSAGNCAATGAYEASGGALDVWVASERRGHWAKATAVRNYLHLNAGDDGEVQAISCSAAGYCALGGDYLDVATGHFQAFLATEIEGSSANAEKVPGIGSLNAGGHSDVDAVSCRRAGYCTAAGSTERSAAVYTAFVISETKGKWGDAARLPNMQNLNKDGNADAGSCRAVRPATASPAEITRTAMVITRHSWMCKRAGSGALRSRCLARPA